MKLLSIGVFSLLTCGLAHASIVFTLGNNPSGDVNILLNSGATGTTVQGTPNLLPGIFINFTSTQVLAEPSSGQARVSANPEGTPLTNIAISLANGGSYGDLIINPFVGGPGVCPNCIGGATTITVNAINSAGVAEAPFVYTGLTLGTGNNFLTIVATGGESIVRTSIVAPGGFNDLRQPRISGPFLGPVPEPATYTLLLGGLGLIGLGLKFKRT
jgi:hypothetical protein